MGQLKKFNKIGNWTQIVVISFYRQKCEICQWNKMSTICGPIPNVFEFLKLSHHLNTPKSSKLPILYGKLWFSFLPPKIQISIFCTQIGQLVAENCYPYYLNLPPMLWQPKLPVEKSFIKQSCWVMSGLPPAIRIFWYIDFGINKFFWESQQIANASRKTRYRSPLIHIYLGPGRHIL